MVLWVETSYIFPLLSDFVSPADCLRMVYSPVQLPVSQNLLHALENVLGDTVNLLSMPHIEVSSWMSWTNSAMSVVSG